MKNIYAIKVFILLCLPFLITSCDDSLDEKVTTFYNAEQVFSTEAGIETAVNGMYASMASPGYYGSGIHGLINPVSGRFYSNQTASNDATSLNCTPENTYLPRLWSDSYTAINVINNLIYNIENNNVDLKNEDVALGQAHFLRGVAYFDLVRYFGGIPLRITPTNNSNYNLAKSSRQEVYAQIIKDFEIAKAKLPENEYFKGRPRKWAAYGYLAKVYMTLAGADGGDATNWQKAYDELLPVIGKYNLTPTYAELFKPGNENTVESIFEIQYTNLGSERNSDVIRLYTPSNSTYVAPTVTTFGRIRPNKEVFDSHVTKYPGDPRIEATFIYDSYPRYPSGTQKIYPAQKTGNFSYAYIKKWLEPTYNGTTTIRNSIVFRYADVLLMMAEIENELRGPSAAYAFVNKVLERARDTNGDGISDAVQPANWSGLDQATFRTRILKERQYELLSEGQDWFDTRRRGYQYFLSEIVYNHNNYAPNILNKEFIYPVSVKNMLLPIPSVELSGNHAMSFADQNPGY
ncbi:RagB/SusD family nutrient uptake outer membrane protein [Flavobacterium sp. RSSA_27]|uniref:RagB/SusD family nutrient uptake outer membrane protein n=1 Tax=Flavobacterium sp. RSSA_27 TaxID=3447667 RepID=UPI003F360866